jgi:ATP-dependent DNA helicase RecG
MYIIRALFIFISMNSPKQKSIDLSVQYIKSVGPKRAVSFEKIGITKIRDLLFYFPTRHLDRTNILTVAKAYEFVKNGFEGEITILGEVTDKEKRRFRKHEVLKVQLKDSSGVFECVWFHGIKYFEKVFNEGEIFAVSSKPEIDRYNRFQFIHPDFDKISEEESQKLLNTGAIIPFYRIPKELKATNIGDLSLRRIIHNAVEKYLTELDETLPGNIITENNLMELKDAVHNYHFPESVEILNAAKMRFKFEEMFYIELLIALRKYNHEHKLLGNKVEIRTNLIADFLKTLSFKLTKSQLDVLSEIKNDMLSEKPMNRLLQGDVGSGKTIVALIAMLIMIDNGFQAVLMAPTEILADQHAKNISLMMERLNEKYPEHKIKVGILIGGQKKSEREKRLGEIELQKIDIIIGTHALFEEQVKFKNLGLVVIDEQHRFGVKQRALLQQKGKTTDVLVMSATPIPRTLSMTVYGDLDISVIKEMPANRIPVKTVLRGEKKLPEIFKFIIDKRKEGYQSFIVYPLVEVSEKLELKAATDYYLDLKEGYLKNLSLGLIHGRMNWQEKEEVMLKFLNKEYDVLISTTVIEVGIDIPDANIILINDAFRFGLSQLHQLRGRVGRGNKQAYCILVSKDEYISQNMFTKLDIEYLSPAQIEKYKSKIRMQTMVETNDGFKISETDLKLRGPGNIFGTKQSGFPELKFVDIVNDYDLITSAKKIAFDLINKDPLLTSPSNKIIRTNLLHHYSDQLKYAKIA